MVIVVSVGGLWFVTMICLGGDPHGRLNWSADEKPSEEYRFETYRVEVMMKS